MRTGAIGSRRLAHRGTMMANKPPSNRCAGASVWFNNNQIVSSTSDMSGKGNQRLMGALLRQLALPPAPTAPARHRPRADAEPPHCDSNNQWLAQPEP